MIAGLQSKWLFRLRLPPAFVSNNLSWARSSQLKSYNKQLHALYKNLEWLIVRPRSKQSARQHVIRIRSPSEPRCLNLRYHAPWPSLYMSLPSLIRKRELDCRLWFWVRASCNPSQEHDANRAPCLDVGSGALQTATSQQIIKTIIPSGDPIHPFKTNPQEFCIDNFHKQLNLHSLKHS